MFLRSRDLVTIAFVLGVAAGLAAAATGAVESERVVPLTSIVSVDAVRSSPATVSGRIVNETGDQLEDVRLLIADDFLWRDEFHPGPDSPATAHAVVVPGPIPPHGSAPFQFERPEPLPDRSDGRFTTDVSVVEVIRRAPATEVAPPPATRTRVERPGRYDEE